MSLINQKGRLASRYFRQKINIGIANATETEFEAQQITAIVIPANNADLQQLPEGERFLPTLKVFTEQPLKCGDLVYFKQDTYRITTATNWGSYGFYHHLATRLSPTAKGHSTGFIVT